MSIIVLENICKRYNEQIILSNFNLTVNKGEMVAIVGKSGTGKSTIMNMIGVLDMPDEGNIEIANIKNPKLSGKQTTLLQRNIIGYLFQNFALIDQMTVSQNLDIALSYVKNTDKEKAKKAVLEKVGLSGFEQKKIFQLSGGEQQRVSIARLMLKPCEIILADEPTGSLDETNRDKILELLKELNKMGKTVIIVTHDSVVKNACSKIVDLETL